MNKWENQAARNILALLTSDEYANRKIVLEKVCSAFNETGIRYALSCSAALFLQGIVDEFNDFDILIALEDTKKTEEVMEKVGGTLEVTIQKNAFTSPYYRESLFRGEHFDLVGDMTVATFNTEYCYKVNTDECQYMAIEGNINVPVVPVEVNLLLYAMMEGWQSKRIFKRNLCMEYLMKNGISYPEILRHALEEQQLPPQIQKLINEIISETSK